MTKEKTETPIPMYVSYATFNTLLEWLKGMPTMPSQLDRSLWAPKFGGGTGSQLMGGLRFLKLVDDEYRPTEQLRALSGADMAERRELMAQLLADAYGIDLVKGLPGATPKQLTETLKALGATDSTHAKASTFLAKAAEFAGIAVPDSIAKRKRGRKAGTRTAKARNRVMAPRVPTGGGKKGSEVHPKEDVETITFEKGGYVKLVLNVSLIQLSAADREFVITLVDQMHRYEQTRQANNGREAADLERTVHRP